MSTDQPQLPPPSEPDCCNPMVFDDPYIAGAFVSSLAWQRRTGFAEARNIHLTAATRTKAGPVEVTTNRPIPWGLYASVMRDVRLVSGAG